MGAPFKISTGSVDPDRTWPDTLAMVKHAEQCGFDACCMHDHPNFPGLDPLIGLTAVAMHTKRIRLWTNVLAVPYRSPGVLAHALASIDVVSGGRLIVGLGTGWDQREFDAYDIPYETGALRRARVIDAMHIMRALWSDGNGTYRGAVSSVTDAVCEPKPIQKPPPIWIGSHNGPKMQSEIVVPYADGWNIGLPTDPGAPTIEEAVANFLRLCKEAGRDPSEIELSTNLLVAGTGADDRLRKLRGPKELSNTRLFALDDLKRLKDRILHLSENGVNHFMIGLTSSSAVDDLTKITKTVVEPLLG